MTDPDDAAFGHIASTGLGATGLTKFEYLAGQMMQGLLASIGQHDVTGFDEMASDAVSAAKALIKELNK